jgi:hypothetical protein
MLYNQLRSELFDVGGGKRKQIIGEGKIDFEKENSLSPSLLRRERESESSMRGRRERARDGSRGRKAYC